MPAMTYKKPKVHRKQTEQSVQLRLCRYIRQTYPFAIFFCDGSGINMSDTMRMNMSAMRSKDDRVLDLNIDHASRGYHGARFEIKPEGTVIYKKDGTLRKQPYVRRFKNGTVKRGDHLAEQAATLLKYNEAGYFGRFIIGFDDGKRKIDYYFDNENASLF